MFGNKNTVLSSNIKCIQSPYKNCEIDIITNIPNRWDTYYGGSYKDKSHGKNIMTNKFVYIGTENYSEESANNTEFGFLKLLYNCK